MSTDDPHRKRGGFREARNDIKLLKEICLLKFHEKKLYKEIIDSLHDQGVKEIKNAGQIAQLIDEAESKGLVVYDIDESFAFLGKQDLSAGRKLCESSKLGQAVVIKVDFDEIARDEPEDDETIDQPLMRRDDYLHTVLANHAGLLIKQQLEDNDHCAVAGGRAVNHTVKMIMRMFKRERPSQKNIMVSSMGGRLWSHQWWRSGSATMRPLDPDDSAFILFQAFEGQDGTMFDQVGQRVFAKTRTEAVTVMKDHCMFQPGGLWYRDQQPNRAIVGVGVVDPDSGHRAVRQYKGSELVEDLMERHLAEVKTELDEAISIAGKCGLHFGDVANRYFPILPLPGDFEKFSPDEYAAVLDELIERLADLNERMVVTEWSHIRSIPSVTAIAGGGFKRRALWTILLAEKIDPHQRIIRTLVTDSSTAKELASAMRAYDALDGVTKEWYRTQAARCFVDPIN